MKKLILLSAMLCMALTQSMAQLPSYVPTSGLIGYWGFNGNANDYSTMANNGIVTGAVLKPDRFGNANSAYQFGLGQRISVPDASYLEGMSSGLSFSFWVRISPFTGQLETNRLIAKTQCGWILGDPYDILVTEDGKLHVLYSYVSTSAYINGSITVADNNWHHVVVTWNVYTAMYVDGVQDMGVTGPPFSGPIATNYASLDFGTPSSGCSGTQGGEYLDEICMYNRALTPAEVALLYWGCTAAPTVTITASGPTTFCGGGNVVLKCNSSATVSYQWQKNNVNISGATSKTYNANATGSYKCVVTNPCGTATSNAISATSMANANITVTATGSTAFCAGDSLSMTVNNPGASYTLQWYRSGISIPAATGYNYTAKQPGTYKVVSRNTTNNCGRISTTGVTATVSCRMANPNQWSGSMEAETSFNPVKLYPNPNAGSFTFEYAGLNEDENQTATIQLYNATSKKVYEFTVDVDNGYTSKDVNLDGIVKSGIYLLKMEINGQVYTSKVMIN